MDLKTINVYVLAALFVFAGVMHFIKPRFYLAMIPPWIPFHRAVVIVSGIAEIALGALLVPPMTRIFAAWGLVVLLIAVFPANVQMFLQGNRKIPKWALLLRLPLQFVLIVWIFYAAG